MSFKVGDKVIVDPDGWEADVFGRSWTRDKVYVAQKPSHGGGLVVVRDDQGDPWGCNAGFLPAPEPEPLKFKVGDKVIVDPDGFRAVVFGTVWTKDKVYVVQADGDGCPVVLDDRGGHWWYFDDFLPAPEPKTASTCQCGARQCEFPPLRARCAADPTCLSAGSAAHLRRRSCRLWPGRPGQGVFCKPYRTLAPRYSGRRFGPP